MSKIKIAIDAGHGLKTPGKRCDKKIDVNQTREWILNSRIANKLEALLRLYDCSVLRVDDTTGQKDISLANRVKTANSWGADVYISIHHNAGVNGGAGGGTVVFYYSSNKERANQAIALYNAIVRKTGLVGNRSSKVNKKGFYVIKNTKMPAFLFENGFMDSTTDVPIILTEDHATKTARGLIDFLVDQFDLKLSTGEEIVTKAPTNKDSSFKVKIAVDELNVRKEPGTNYPAVMVVRKGEVYTIVETSGSWGKLKSGAGWINISSKYATRL